MNAAGRDGSLSGKALEFEAAASELFFLGAEEGLVDRQVVWYFLQKTPAFTISAESSDSCFKCVAFLMLQIMVGVFIHIHQFTNPLSVDGLDHYYLRKHEGSNYCVPYASESVE